MKHSQFNTDFKAKWDGNTLETKGGYRVEREPKWYRVYPPDGISFIAKDRLAVEMQIRQHMHEANMANGYDIDLAKKFVEGEDWNGFPWADRDGVRGHIVDKQTGRITSYWETLMLAHQIVNGEIDDPRREHFADASKKVEHPDCPICSGDPSKSKFCPGCMDKIDEAQKQFECETCGDKSSEIIIRDSDGEAVLRCPKGETLTLEVVEVPCNE